MQFRALGSCARDLRSFERLFHFRKTVDYLHWLYFNIRDSYCTATLHGIYGLDIYAADIDVQIVSKTSVSRRTTMALIIYRAIMLLGNHRIIHSVLNAGIRSAIRQ